MVVGFLAMMLMTLSPAGADQAMKNPDFAPYAFLIGEWDIHEQGSPPAAVTRAYWSGGGTSIRLETDLIVSGKSLPHYEGVLIWNPVRRDFDMLLNLDLNTAKVQERGRVNVSADGVVTREIIASYAPGVVGPDGKKVGPAGAEFEFRQIFTRLSDDEIETSMMRRTTTGWVATFPGSEEIRMTRRKSKAV